MRATQLTATATVTATATNMEGMAASPGVRNRWVTEGWSRRGRTAKTLERSLSLWMGPWTRGSSISGWVGSCGKATPVCRPAALPPLPHALPARVRASYAPLARSGDILTAPLARSGDILTEPRLAGMHALAGKDVFRLKGILSIAGDDSRR
jgi:hypothetical protein